MVESMVGLLRDRLVGEKAANVGCQLGCPRRPILRLVVALGKTPEVIDQGRSGPGRADRERRIFPRGGDDQYRAWMRQRLRPRRQLGYPEGVVDERWCAVADVERGDAAGVPRGCD